MSVFKPFSTLLVGVALGVWVVPKITRAANINLPGS